MKAIYLLIPIFIYCFSTLAQEKTSSLQPSEQLNNGIELIKEAHFLEGVELLKSINSDLDNLHSTSQQALLNFYLAEGYYGLNHKDSALLFYQHATEGFKASQDTLKMAECLYNISYQQLINGLYDESLENIQLANQSYNAVNDSVGMLKSLTWTSIIYHDSREYELGIEYGIQAYEFAKLYQAENADLKARALNAVAINYDDFGNYDKAIEYHLKVIGLKFELSDTTRLAPTYNNIGNSLMKKGDYKTATTFFLKNKKITELKNNKYGLATVLTNLGTVAYLNKQWNDAALFLNKAEKISYEIGDAEKIQDILFQQYEYHKATNKLPIAINYLTNYYHFKDSLLNIKKLHAIRELETIYKTKEKETEIALQNNKIALQDGLIQKNFLLIIGLVLLVGLLLVSGFLYKNKLTKQQELALKQKEIEFKEAQLNAIIATQEKERTRFASDLHDSFGQTISVLKMNIDTAQKNLKSSPEAEKLYNESKKMLGEMHDELRGVCFNLMPTTLIKVGLVKAISEFSQRVNAAGKINIEVNNFGLDKRLEELSEISIYRIVQEWVNNILKYNSASKVIIQFTTDENEITLTIEDNGKGFDTSLLKQSKGNGWININSRVKLLGGTVEVDSTNGQNGSILIMNAPIKYV